MNQQYPSLLLERAVGEFSKLPGIGRKTAMRLVLHLLKQDYAMVENFGCDLKNIRAAIGPNLAQCHFETDGDVPHALIGTFGREALPYIKKQGEKFHPDLKAVNALAMRRRGVEPEHIEISDACTWCESDRFWSHRVTKGDRGSQGAVITCKEVK